MKKFILCLAVILLITLSACSKTSSKITIEFETNGGNIIADMKLEENMVITLPNNPERLGYFFDGWYIDNGNYNVPFTEDYLLTNPIEDSITIYAKWVHLETSLTTQLVEIYQLGKQSGQIVGNYDDWLETIRGEQGIPGVDGKQIELRVEDGYIQWHYQDTDSWVNLLDINLIGIDTSLFETFTVTFYTEGGTLIEPQEVSYAGKVTTPSAPEREGFIFTYWSYGSTELEWNFFGYGVTEDITLVANYEPIFYYIDVYLVDEDGYSYMYDYHYVQHGMPHQIVEPYLYGLNFEGYYYDEEFTIPFDYSDTFTESDVLYIKTSRMEFTLVISDGENNVLYENNFFYGDDVTGIYLLDLDNDDTTEEKIYYTHNFSYEADMYSMPAQDVWLYAKSTPTEPLTPLPENVEGEITIAVWGGSGNYFEDIGHQTLTRDDLSTLIDASYFAVAKAFNEQYPNVIINLFSVSGDPNQDTPWEDKLIDFAIENGGFPSIWMTTDLPKDVSNGMVADLSRFKDDELYTSMNATILDMMNYGGFQAGLPQSILPWGIYVNKELADTHSITVPDPLWTIDEYTTFIGHHIEDEYYGSMDTPIRIIETGVNTITKQLLNYVGTGDYVDLNSDEVRSLIPYIHIWDEHSVWGSPQNSTFMDEHDWWGYKFFSDGVLLTLESDPWMLLDCASDDTTWEFSCSSNDWDIYPRPSTDFVDNTVGILLDPIAIFNYCLEDSDLGCTPSEEQQIQLAYTFAAYSIADTDAWNAKAAQEYLNTGSDTYNPALGFSLPITTGSTYEEQMAIWEFVPSHTRFTDETLMPGFQEVLTIYETGQFWDISDKAFPYYYTAQGNRYFNLYEWKSYWNSSVNGGVLKSDSNYTEIILDQLEDWNDYANERFNYSFAELQNGLHSYYNHQFNQYTLTEISIYGVNDITLDIDSQWNALTNVTVFGDDYNNYYDYLEITTDDCILDEQYNLDTTTGISCTITYTLEYQGITVTANRIVRVLDTTIMYWDFSEEADLTGWEIYSDMGGSVVMSIEDGAMKLVTTSGQERHQTRIDYMGINLEAGNYYEISFKMKSSINNKLIHLAFGELLDYSPWFNTFKDHGADFFYITTDWEEYSAVFYMSETNFNGGPLFEMGDMPYSVGLDATLWIDDIIISFVE